MMTNRSRAGWMCFGLLCLFVTVSTFGTWHVLAAGEQPPGPDRFKVVIQDYASYVWWLTNWADNKVACTVKVDHNGLPTGGEVFTACGKTLYDKWFATSPCTPDTTCSGYYLQFIKTEPAQRKVAVTLPPPVVWVSLDGCVPYNSTFRCDGLPTLVLTGEEPLDGENITGITGRMDGTSFTCDAVCPVDLAPTSDAGMLLEFWATSSYGDSSVLFEARVRVIALDDPNNTSWFVDVLSTQWQGAPLAGCSQIWDVFPPVGGVPDWLSMPASAKDLATNIPYEYLAANLIKQGITDASTCTDGGLLETGLVSPCGMETARAAVTDWQNRFDELIFTAAYNTNIPAHVLKTIFGRESQFWPGMIDGLKEAGLGQMTPDGADTVLLWNQPFYEQFCPSVLEDRVCKQGYTQLSIDYQETLRNALVAKVNAICPDCEMGIDINRAENSVGIFAETLLANCTQTGMIVHNTFGGTAGASATYEDLWRFTLVNYHAGPGCLTLAIWETKRRAEPLDWEHLSSHLTPVCQGALDYVTYINAASP